MFLPGKNLNFIQTGNPDACRHRKRIKAEREKKRNKMGGSKSLVWKAELFLSASEALGDEGAWAFILESLRRSPSVGLRNVPLFEFLYSEER